MQPAKKKVASRTEEIRAAGYHRFRSRSCLVEQATVPVSFCPFGQARPRPHHPRIAYVMVADCMKRKAAHRGTLVLLTLLLSAVLLSGCVGTTGASTSDGLSATTASVSFGNVNTGTTVNRSVSISNAGVARLSVSNISISGAGFSVSGVPAGLTLTPGQAADLSVTFAPASAGSVTGRVTIADATSPDQLAIMVSGTGVTPTGHSVTLTWNASTSSVAGYRTYRATTAGGPYTSLNSSPNPQLQWKDSTVQAGTTYYYVVAAVAADTTESAYSNQASAAVPKP